MRENDKAEQCGIFYFIFKLSYNNKSQKSAQNKMKVYLTRNIICKYQDYRVALYSPKYISFQSLKSKNFVRSMKVTWLNDPF